MKDQYVKKNPLTSLLAICFFVFGKKKTLQDFLGCETVFNGYQMIPAHFFF